MKGQRIYSVPHPLGVRRVRGWTPEGQEHYQNERAWRRHSIAEQQDRTAPGDSVRWQTALEADRMHGRRETGPGWEFWQASLRPLPLRFFARRHSPFAHLTRIVVPDAVNRYDAQNAGACYHVLAVGAGITSITPGNLVIASAHVGSHMGETVGPQIRELWADVDYVQDGESDVIRRAGGDVLALVMKGVGGMHLEPTLDRVVVKRSEAASESDGGLIIPDVAKKKSQRGEVLAVGPGPWKANGEAPFVVGDVVLFGEHAGIDVRVGAEDYVVLREEEAIGLLRERHG